MSIGGILTNLCALYVDSLTMKYKWHRMLVRVTHKILLFSCIFHIMMSASRMLLS